MSQSLQLLAFAGSSREESFNRRLLAIAVAMLEAEGIGWDAPAPFAPDRIELADYPLPIYDGDLEAARGVPENAVKLRALFKAHRGLLIAAPEYNSSISPLLKNTLDWVSRPVPGEPGSLPYQDKLAALLAASPGALGGVRGLAALRSILVTLGVMVLPQQFGLAQAHDGFAADGSLRDARARERLHSVLAALARWLRAAAGGDGPA